MKAVARPVEVTYYKIFVATPGDGIPDPHGQGHHSGGYTLEIANDDQSDYQTVFATPEMCARMTPIVGDYWVIQEDGYIYLNPKAVFEKKYMPKSEYERAQPVPDHD